MGPTPPVTAEYTSALQGPQPNVPPVQSAYRFCRATDGKTRVDTGNTSVISNPATGQTILLDHVKKTATIHPASPTAPPGAPQMPHFSAPGLPGMPHAPSVQVQDLGKSVFQGQEVEGKRFLIQPHAMPKTPGVPKPPKAPTVAEVWTSSELRVPMHINMSGGFGQVTQVCKSAVSGEPHPSTFQIPSNYKMVTVPLKPPIAAGH